jgi:hypothetical protein
MKKFTTYDSTDGIPFSNKRAAEQRDNHLKRVMKADDLLLAGKTLAVCLKEAGCRINIFRHLGKLTVTSHLGEHAFPYAIRGICTSYPTNDGNKNYVREPFHSSRKFNDWRVAIEADAGEYATYATYATSIPVERLIEIL